MEFKFTAILLEDEANIVRYLMGKELELRALIKAEKTMVDHIKRQIQEIPLSSEQKGQKICICYEVYADEIIEVIQNGADSVENISELTYACQGCGSCRLKIEALLATINSVSRD
ncbi:MAG: (2Fe-2S)-binding protein [Pseudomonadota bacterium]